jgi:Notch-like protein
MNEYSCACKPGYTNGVCADNFIEEYTGNCTVATGGSCEVDVDECASSPCRNGATCLAYDDKWACSCK